MAETDTRAADDSADTDESTVDELMESGADEQASGEDPKATTGDGSSDDSDDEGADEPEPMAPPVDQSPALRNDGALNLGLCHFGGIEEPASVLATRTDGTGWIAVCDKHTKDAEEQGYVIEESAAENANKGDDKDG